MCQKGDSYVGLHTATCLYGGASFPNHGANRSAQHVLLVSVDTYYQRGNYELCERTSNEAFIEWLIGQVFVVFL